ncbi:hypothetical protein SAMN05216177_10631 [Ectopseudomonas toyotomiensis]|uniref:Uncharacterized protein n=1 Tax=Ectopseudomonas toyotomiensis TaxID=554344 RepID=A0A1I5U676_9GAMM|nr:hypothetical protein SAMN05216177_10631 [Pseudomonas toyotomiensis]
MLLRMHERTRQDPKRQNGCCRREPGRYQSVHRNVPPWQNRARDDQDSATRRKQRQRRGRQQPSEKAENRISESALKNHMLHKHIKPPADSRKRPDTSLRDKAWQEGVFGWFLQGSDSTANRLGIGQLTCNGSPGSWRSEFADATANANVQLAEDRAHPDSTQLKPHMTWAPGQAWRFIIGQPRNIWSKKHPQPSSCC